MQSEASVTVVHTSGSAKVTVTVLLAVTVTAQVVGEATVLVQPDQPTKTEPVAAAACRVTLVPESKDAEQVVPQVMPAGAEVTVPLPDVVTVSVGVATKLAVTDLAAAIVTVHVSVTGQAAGEPWTDQPWKVELAAAVAVRTMSVP